MTRFDTAQATIPDYALQVEKATNADEVRAVTQAALADPRVSHRVYHALGLAAREKIAGLKNPVLAPVALATDDPHDDAHAKKARR